jgi:three-Cys-motif partner protein
VARKDDMPLFSDRDLLSDAELRAEEAQALQPVEVEKRRDLDAARQWRSRDDGLLVRGVKPHSAEKSRLVGRALGTVTAAMSGKWFQQRHGLQYVELYSGPGRLLDERTGLEEPGSPIQALHLHKPFDLYVFSDAAEDCRLALRERVGDREDAHVLRGDANDQSHLQAGASLLNSKALVIAYLDPARPQDLRWSTVAYLAQNFPFMDLIINLPCNSLMRAIHGHYRAGGRGEGAAGRFLDHPQPKDLLRPTPERYSTSATIDAIRQHYDQKLMGLGFLPPARRTVAFPADNPYYDILYVSRHPRGVQLWDKTNPPPDEPPTLF